MPDTITISALRPAFCSNARERVQQSLTTAREWLETSILFDESQRPTWSEEVWEVEVSPHQGRTLHRNWLWNKLSPLIVRLHADYDALVDEDPYSAYKSTLEKWTWMPRPDAPPGSLREFARCLVESRHGIILQGVGNAEGNGLISKQNTYLDSNP